MQAGFAKAVSRVDRRYTRRGLGSLLLVDNCPVAMDVAGIIHDAHGKAPVVYRPVL